MPSVLVVDDDRDLLEMVGSVLSSYKMKVHCLSEGATLFNTINEVHPDVLLMDIYLGDSDGWNLCHSIKTSDDYKHIPVILYSAGYVTTASIHEALADEFLVKPFNIKDLINKINTLVKE